MLLDIHFAKALILAIVQGITEWFPVSSSGHLVLFERILNYSGGLDFEVALHFGTLMAVFVYFGKDIVNILREFLRGNYESENGRIGWLLIVATIPAAIAGFLVKDFFDSVLGGVGIVAFGFGITGVLLLITAYCNVKNKKPGFKAAFLIGLAQAVAIIPGISRSGATISSGILLGLKEKDAMKFSFLMAIPVILGANFLSIGDRALSAELIWATLVSFVVGLLSIHFVFSRLLVKRKNFKWFGVYALLVTLGIFAWILIRT